MSQFLLDVRTPWEFEGSKIEGSINIPMQEIPNNIEKLKQTDKQILIICRSGARAHVVKDFLEQNKISNTRVLEGGIVAHGTGPIS